MPKTTYVATFDRILDQAESAFWRMADVAEESIGAVGLGAEQADRLDSIEDYLDLRDNQAAWVAQLQQRAAETSLEYAAAEAEAHTTRMEAKIENAGGIHAVRVAILMRRVQRATPILKAVEKKTSQPAPKVLPPFDPYDETEALASLLDNDQAQAGAMSVAGGGDLPVGPPMFPGLPEAAAGASAGMDPGAMQRPVMPQGGPSPDASVLPALAQALQSPYAQVLKPQQPKWVDTAVGTGEAIPGGKRDYATTGGSALPY